MMMMMKSVLWWGKPEYPEETTGLRQVTDETSHIYGLCPVRGLNLGRSGVKQSELRRDESDAHRATAAPIAKGKYGFTLIPVNPLNILNRTTDTCMLDPDNYNIFSSQEKPANQLPAHSDWLKLTSVFGSGVGMWKGISNSNKSLF